MLDIGWISIHRKITGHWIWEAKPFSYGQAWVDILLECNHTGKKSLIKGHLVETKRGQSSNSLKTWADRFGWSYDAVRHFFKILKKDSMITTTNAGVTTILTVCNYDTYQNPPQSKPNQNPIESQSNPTGTPTNNNDNNANNDNNDILRAREAFAKISKSKPTNHEYIQINHLVHNHGIDSVLKAIHVCGDQKWDKIYALEQVIKGEWPLKQKAKEVFDGSLVE